MLSLIFLFSCSNSFSKDEYLEAKYIMELIDGDNKDMYGCSLLIDMGEWEASLSRDQVWSRHTSLRWNDGVTQTETGISINYRSNSIDITKDSKKSLIYVGKWHHVKKIGKS